MGLWAAASVTTVALWTVQLTRLPDSKFPVGMRLAEAEPAGKVSVWELTARVSPEVPGLVQSRWGAVATPPVPEVRLSA